MPWAAIIPAVIAGGSAIGGAALSSSAANKAAKTQAEAASQATAEQARQFNIAQQNQQPWLDVGKSGLNALSVGLGLGGLDQSKYYQLEGDPVVEIPAGMDFYGQKTARLSQLEQWLAGQESMTGGRAQGYSDVKTLAENARTQATQQEMAAKGITSGSGDGQSPVASGDLLRDFTMADYEEDPGYQFRLTEGQKAIDKTAAAKGRALSGGAVKAQTRYASDQASQEYGNAFNRYQIEHANKYNRLAGISGTGQTQANQLAAQGQQYANNVGDLATQAANARASGYVASGNAWNNAISGTAQNLLNLYLQNQANTSNAPYDTTYLYDIANF